MPDSDILLLLWLPWTCLIYIGAMLLLKASAFMTHFLLLWICTSQNSLCPSLKLYSVDNLTLFSGYPRTAAAIIKTLMLTLNIFSTQLILCD